jgi:uncharacterized protein (TIGR02145 family)
MKFINPACSLTGSCSNAGIFLKATSGWNSGGNGADVYGFAALPSGRGVSENSFNSVGNECNWWSATEYGANYAYYREMEYSSGTVNRSDITKSRLYSVRCVRD